MFLRRGRHAHRRTHRHASPHHILYIVASLFLTLLSATPTHAKDVNNFYFKDFSADYYVTRDEDGISHLKVVEALTAVFPGYNQNLGIVRRIPYINQDGANITIPSRAALNVSVTRNGQKEHIYSIEKEDGYYSVSTGDDTTYLHGEQTFVFSYEFEKVITSFDGFQELYWDTNGTGWPQRFDQLSARVHFSEEILAASGESSIWSEATSCYVGKYGVSDSERCTITKLADGYEFQTKSLKPGENLSFAIRIPSGTFVTPSTINSTFVIFATFTTIVFIITLILFIKYLRAAKPCRDFYKGLFVAPQYLPPKNLTVAAAAELSLKSTADSRVATLIELAVTHKITLIKEDAKSKKWQFRVNSLSGLSAEQKIILEIMNGGELPTEASTVEIKRHRANVAMQTLGRQYYSSITERLKKKQLLLNTKINLLSIVSTIWSIIAIFVFMLVVDSSYGVIPGGSSSLGLVMLMNIFIFIGPTIAVSVNSKYLSRSEAGLRASNYLEGLKLYMKMAEAERLQFLQSVDGADTTSTGIVKLYEKLLPYAIIFGLEISWMKELSRYYEQENIDRPSWYMGATYLSLGDFRYLVSSSASTIMSSTASSSSGSGSGGGGFSGGGGGGGGGGGR